MPHQQSLDEAATRCKKSYAARRSDRHIPLKPGW